MLAEQNQIYEKKKKLEDGSFLQTAEAKKLKTQKEKLEKIIKAKSSSMTSE